MTVLWAIAKLVEEPQHAWLHKPFMHVPLTGQQDMARSDTFRGLRACLQAAQAQHVHAVARTCL